MRLPARFIPFALAVLISSTSLHAEGDKSKWALGQDWDVRVTARVEAATPTANVVRVAWEIENLSEHPIEIARVEPVASWDPSTRVVTLNVGSELPPEESAKYIDVGPKERKMFSTSAPLGLGGVTRGRAARIKRLVRVKVHFLEAGPGQAGATEGDPLDSWIEQKRSVVTNAIPVATAMAIRDPGGEGSRRAGTRRP